MELSSPSLLLVYLSLVKFFFMPFFLLCCLFTDKIDYLDCNFALKPHVCLFVVWSARSMCHNFLKIREAFTSNAPVGALLLLTRPFCQIKKVEYPT